MGNLCTNIRNESKRYLFKIYTGHEDKLLRITDPIQVKEPLKILNEFNSYINCLIKMKTYLITGENNRIIKVFDCSDDYKLIQTLIEHKGAVNCIKYSDPHIYTGSSDNSIKIWLFSGKLNLVKTIQLTHSVDCMLISFGRVFIGCYLTNIFVYNTTDELSKYKILEKHNDSVNCITEWNKYIISGSDDKSLVLWDLINLEYYTRLYIHSNSIISLLVLSDKIFISGDKNGVINVWNSDIVSIYSILAHNDSVNCLSFENNLIISASSDKRIKFWDSTNGFILAKEIFIKSDAILCLATAKDEFN